MNLPSRFKKLWARSKRKQILVPFKSAKISCFLQRWPLWAPYLFDDTDKIHGLVKFDKFQNKVKYMYVNGTQMQHDWTLDRNWSLS